MFQIDVNANICRNANELWSLPFVSVLRANRTMWTLRNVDKTKVISRRFCVFCLRYIDWYTEQSTKRGSAETTSSWLSLLGPLLVRTIHVNLFHCDLVSSRSAPCLGITVSLESSLSLSVSECLLGLFSRISHAHSLLIHYHANIIINVVLNIILNNLGINSKLSPIFVDPATRSVLLLTGQ